MALSTTQYGYIIDPMVPFTDGKGNTIKDGFVRVFVAGSSTPVITYRNFDGAENQDLIELDNSGRTKTSVIGSKGITYKVCVYDQMHSQESPILTVDKVSVIGANITAGAGATVVTGLDGLTTKPDGFVDASVVGTDGYVALDHTLVTDDLNTDAKVTAVENDRYVPLLNEDVNDPDSKMTLGRMWKWVLGKIKSLPTTITAFRTGDVIPVDGPNGTAKMSKDDLLQVTAENALGSIHSLSEAASEDDLGAENYFLLDGIAGPKKLPANAIVGACIKNKFGESVTETIDGQKIFHFINVIKIGEKSVYFRFTCESPFVAQLWDDTQKKFDILESGYLYKINTESFVGACKLYVYTTDSSTEDARVDTFVESELFNESKLFSKDLFDTLGSASIEKENVVYTNHVYNISGNVGDTASLIEYTLPNYSGVIVDVEEKNVTAFNITGICTSSVIGTFTILDKNNVILQNSVDTMQYDHYNVILPKNAKYIVIGALTLYDYGCVLFKSKVLEEEKKIENIKTELDGQYDEVEVLEYKNGFVDSVGIFDYREEGEGYIANVYDVSGVKKIRLKSSVSHNARYASFYAGEPSTLNPSISFVQFSNIDDVVLDVPATAVYFIVNSVFGNVGSVNDVSIFEETEEGIKDRLDVLENLSIDWSNKTWLMIGDSLTEKNFRAQVSYYDYVKQVTNVNLLNKGKSGNGYVDGDWFYTALGQVSADSFDFCTIFGSGNDLRYEITSLSDKSSWEEALGNVNDNGTMSICGYMNRAISRFFELFPLKRIGIVTPTKWKNASYGAAQMTDEETLRRMTDYSRVLVQIANKWGIPVLDLFHTSGLQPQIEAYRLEFYIENGVQDPGVHPNSKGHKLIYKQFMDFIDVNLVT